MDNWLGALDVLVMGMLVIMSVVFWCLVKSGLVMSGSIVSVVRSDSVVHWGLLVHWGLVMSSLSICVMMSCWFVGRIMV